MIYSPFLHAYVFHRVHRPAFPGPGRGPARRLQEGAELPEQLPDATEQGLNTAGWLLDGRAWVPVRSTISTGTPVTASRWA